MISRTTLEKEDRINVVRHSVATKLGRTMAGLNHLLDDDGECPECGAWAENETVCPECGADMEDE